MWRDQKVDITDDLKKKEGSETIGFAALLVVIFSYSRCIASIKSR